MTATNQNAELWAGEAKSLAVTVSGIDLTGKTITWTLSADQDSAAAVLTKTTSAGITIDSATQFTVALTAANTEGLAGVYYQKAVVTDGVSPAVVMEGHVTVHARVATGLYCNLDTLKRRISVPDADDDAELERIITAVSRAIDGYCGRRFYAATQTRTYTATRGDRILVDDLLSVTTLKTDEDGDGTYEVTWQASDYRLKPSNAVADGEPYWQIVVSPNGSHSFPCRVDEGVQVAGSWGYSSATPPVVEDACLAQSAIEYSARHNNGGTDGEANSVMKVSLHPFAKKALSEAGLVRVSVA
jgi:hypothetical protein